MDKPDPGRSPVRCQAGSLGCVGGEIVGAPACCPPVHGEEAGMIRFEAGFGAGRLDEILSRLLGGDPSAGLATRVQRADLSRRLSDQSRELLQRAAAQATAWGSPDLDTEHLSLTLQAWQPDMNTSARKD